MNSAYWVALVWGLVVLASWVGWGELLRAGARVERERVGWAMRAGWGMAVELGICGFLEWAGLGNWMGLTGVLVVGAVACGGLVFEQLSGAEAQRSFLAALSWRRWILVSPLIGVLVYLYASSVVAFDMNWWDDLANYAVYAKKLLQTGSMVEPYSLRRLLTYGGQQTLDAMVMIGGTFLNIDILEQGLARVVFAGLLWEMVKPRKGMERAVAGLVVVVLLLATRAPLVTVNTHSEMTGVVLFLTLMGTLSLVRGATGEWGMAAAVGIVGAAICTLRVNFMPAAFFSIVFVFAGRMVFERARWRAYGAALVITAAAFAVCLLPWAMGLWRSSGTLLYPMWAGNQRPEHAYFDAALSMGAKGARVLGFLGTAAGATLMAPLLLAGCRRFWRTELPMAGAVLVTVVMTLVSYSLTGYDNIYRYEFPMAFGIGAFLVLWVVVRGGTGVRRGIGVAMVAGLAVMHVVPGVLWLVEERGQIWRRAGESPLLTATGSAPAYFKAQQAVPAGAGIFSATSFPVLFDFERNPIYIADFPGAASPPPGMPIFAGGAAVKGYLKGQGIGYVILTLPERDLTLYSREYWTRVREHPEEFSPDVVRRSRFDYQFMVVMGELMGSEEILYRSKTLCVVHLQ